MEDIKISVCKNPWCKATFEYKEDVTPEFCRKCESFDKDLSGGVTWTDKKYEGSRYDGRPHMTSVKVNKFSR